MSSVKESSSSKEQINEEAIFGAFSSRQVHIVSLESGSETSPVGTAAQEAIPTVMLGSQSLSRHSETVRHASAPTGI
jgi:hypothetical protein